jgi:hypothetical protein
MKVSIVLTHKAGRHTLNVKSVTRPISSQSVVGSSERLS